MPTGKPLGGKPRVTSICTHPEGTPALGLVGPEGEAQEEWKRKHKPREPQWECWSRRQA
jgi:hypothetical protein